MKQALVRHIRALILVIVCVFASIATAQDIPDFDSFDKLAAAIETDLQENRISDEAFVDLRARLVDWRESFIKAKDANAIQIEALNAQIQALGPAPAEGETEAENVANRRAALQEELAKAQEPRISADEGHARADALIGRIDATLRARQTDKLFELQDSPLMPEQWSKGAAGISAILGKVRSEVVERLSWTDGKSDLTRRLPITAILTVIAFILIARGPRWVERLIARVEAHSGEHGRIFYGFLISFGGMLAPMLGITALNGALIATGVLGDTSLRLAVGINVAILTYAAGRWIGGRIFPERSLIPSPLVLSDKERKSARQLTMALGFNVGLMQLVGSLEDAGDIESGTAGVLTFPFFLLMGLIMFRLGTLIWRGGVNADDEDPTSYTDFIARMVGRVLQAVALIGPLAAAIGYYNMAIDLLVPTATSLGMIGLLVAVHFAFRAAYGLLRGLSADEVKEALAPVLVSFALVLVSVPVFALAWGARTTDISEVWTRFRAGFRVGETTISPGVFLTFALVFAAGFMLTRLVQGTLRTSVLPRTRIDKGGQNALISGLGYIGLTIAAIAGITAAGIDLSSLAIIVGALGVGIGFGLQNIVNNFVSGIILLIERPISEGDWVEVNGQMGVVRSISVRSTVIETFDRRDVIVPNGDLISGTVTNWTRENSLGRVIVPVGVAYGTDTRKVEAILKGVAEAHPIVAVNPAPQVFFTGFGADSLDFEIRAILTDVNYLLSSKSDINHEIARRFAEEGIEIPFAQRDIWLRNPEALAGAVSGPRPPSGPVDQALATPGDDGDSA